MARSLHLLEEQGRLERDRERRQGLLHEPLANEALPAAAGAAPGGVGQADLVDGDSDGEDGASEGGGCCKEWRGARTGGRWAWPGIRADVDIHSSAQAQLASLGLCVPSLLPLRPLLSYTVTAPTLACPCRRRR
jgi:hypothetical protein